MPTTTTTIFFSNPNNDNIIFSISFFVLSSLFLSSTSPKVA